MNGQLPGKKKLKEPYHSVMVDSPMTNLFK